MSYLKTKGIVIREVNVGEADKILTVFTKARGKLSVLARGARRQRSRMVASTQLLCYSDYVLFKGKEYYTINSCEAIEPFYEIRNDVVKLTYSAHIIDLVNDVVQENQSSGRVLQLFLNTLHLISATSRSPELLTRIFEIRLMSILGYAPYVKGCLCCGREELDSVAFSFKQCGLLCSEEHCTGTDPAAFNLSLGTAKALRHIVHSPLEEVFSFNVSDSVLEELASVSRRYVRERMERDYSRLDFLKAINTGTPNNS